MFNFTISKRFDFLNLFPVCFYDGEEAAPGGGSGVDLKEEGGKSEPAPEPFGDDAIIPKEFMAQAEKNDPELRELREAEEAQKAEKAKKARKEGELPPPKKDEEPPKKKDETEAKETEKEEDFEQIELADDIIPGLKGEDMKKLGEDGAVALANFHTEHQEQAEELKNVKKRLSDLLTDPVVKARQEMRAKGKTQYEFRQINDTEKQSAINALVQHLELTPEEATAAFELLKPGFEQYGKEIAESALQNRIQETDAETKRRETVSKARGIIHGFGKFNKDLEFKETNPDAFWKIGEDENGKPVSSLNEDHPEIEKFKKYTMPVMDALAKAGFTYEQLIKMSAEFGEDAIYAIAAKKLGLPAAINSGERDKKIIQGERKKILKAFMKNSGSDELRSDAGSSISGAKKKEGNNDGIDLNRLLDDPDYEDELYRKKPNDPEWMDKVADYRRKAAIARRNKGK